MKPFFIAGAMLLAGSLHAQTLKISGEVKGLTGPVYVMGNKATNSTTDTIPVINGKFAAVIKVNKEPGRRSIMIGRYGFGTWVEPGELRITGDASDMKSFSLAGTPTQDDREKFDRQWDTSMLRMRKWYAEMAEDTTHDTKAVQKMAMSEASAMRHKITVDFIRKHPDSYYSLFLLTEMQEDHQQQMDLYAMLTPRIKASAMGKEFSENIAISKRSANGEKNYRLYT
ncbi:DUF4369 domain-containing protein [Chitinophaga sedimenti]|uniref:DUF4369 domain-containing protein n=1 Tax=Chitinophaga sedimenti TaxID=2033606 RepID=UPI00200345A8|nr:DUF4369 domain-containing protein [Chitinophaga sedimenti]MCK7555619.1 DUF4369 domain-containing protein [Chitinophaga sedimenti]